MTAGARRSFGDPVMEVGEPVHKPYHPTVINDFLRAVKVPGTTFSTLAIFAEALEHNSEELVREIVRRSTGTEVASLLNDAHKLKSADIALIFTVLEKIILMVAAEMEGMESFALELSEALITKQMRTFYYMLKTTNKSNQIKSALKLLIAMCALGSRTVKVLLTHFNFTTCNFSNLVTRRNTVDPQDVRACAVHFIVAVLMFGDNFAARTLLETKNLVGCLFSGLVVDRSQLIHLLLSTLLDRVVNNLTVSKTLKIQLFNQTALKQLCRVLSWNGHKKSEKEFMEEDVVVKSNLEERNEIRDAVLRFLTAVCSSTKFGIVFQDPSFGSSTKNYNHILTELLRTLTLSSAYHRELARVILIAAPDQIVHFLPTWKPGFVPRVSEKWTDMMSWLDSVYADLDVAKKVKKIPRKSRVPVALTLIIPPFLDRELQTEAFSEKQTASVCVSFLKFLRNVLLRVYRILLVLGPEEKQLFLEGSIERIVSIEVVSGCFTSILNTTTTKISEADIRETVSYLVLDSVVFSRELPTTLTDVLPGEIQSAQQAVTLELAKIAEEFRDSPQDGASELALDGDADEAVVLEKQSKSTARHVRTWTATLLLDALKVQPVAIPVSLMEVVMSAYTATLSEADQCLFDIIRGVELSHRDMRNSVSFSVFGRLAQKQQSLRAKQGVSLIPSQPTLREFVDGLDSNLVARTSRNFPFRLPLNGLLVGKLVMDDVYDPRYILSNFAVLLTTPGTPINILHFIESGCLGLIVRALSSLDRAMRAAAGFCLRNLIIRAEALRFRGKEQMLYVLELIKRRNEPGKAWPNLWTVLLSRFFSVMFDSQNHAYQVTMEFLLVKPDLAIDVVPEFYKLFESGNVSHGKERKFILEVMRDGVQHQQDYLLGQKSHAWEIIMSFFASPLSNPAMDALISEVFLMASQVPAVGRGLVKTNGFFTWLTYQLTVTDNAEIIGNLIASAGNCMSDLLRTKRRIPFDACSLIKPMLLAVEKGAAATVSGSIISFLSDLLICYPSDGAVYLVLPPDDLNSVVDLGVKHLAHARRILGPSQWRHCCYRTMENVKCMRRMQQAGEVKIYVLQRFLADVSGMVTFQVDID